MKDGILKNLIKSICTLIPDKPFLKIKFRYCTGRRLNLSYPKTFNEKLQWLKLFDRRPEYTTYVDKYAVREHIAETIGEDYLIPVLGVYNNVDDIDWAALPSQFVLKCTHGSGCNIICDDKTRLDIEASKTKLRKWMKTNYFWHGREWPYKNVKPRILCEEFLFDNTDGELKDYRFFCFNGEPRFVAVDFSITDKSKTRRNLYDLSWRLMDEEISYPKELSDTVQKPKRLNEMVDLSRTLAEDFPHVRIDFYYVNDKIYFGEITFYHQAGYGRFRPQEFDELLGSWIDLP